ncbi:hypothetical protein [Propionivibrio sp.]|uniref:hypothetical protein n=1 Tax=Propionivibrio sp. TaxID=2212460 RepID=UPI0025E65EA7|nr:hypothetical protein [Propionivibrio sp.]
MILNIFSSRPDHPLGDPKELKRAIAELPLDKSFKAVDEVYGWFESLHQAEGFRVDHLFDVVRQLDEAAQASIRRLSRDYLNPQRLSKTKNADCGACATTIGGKSPVCMPIALIVPGKTQKTRAAKRSRRRFRLLLHVCWRQGQPS